MNEPEKPDLHLLEVVPPVADSVPPGDSEPDGEEVLNALELRFVELIAAGHSYEDTGAQIGRSPRTCRRWMKRGEIVAAVKVRAAEQVSAARAILTSGMSRAARSLVDMSDGKVKAEPAKVAASKAVIDSTTRLVEVEEIQSRLSELEAAVNPPGQPGSNKGRF
jgi:Helix-turn-helix domain